MLLICHHLVFFCSSLASVGPRFIRLLYLQYICEMFLLEFIAVRCINCINMFYICTFSRLPWLCVKHVTTAQQYYGIFLAAGFHDSDFCFLSYFALLTHETLIIVQFIYLSFCIDTLMSFYFFYYVFFFPHF